MPPSPPLRVAVMGAGCVGAWLGGRLADAGHDVVLIGRPALADAVDRAGLEVVELSGRSTRPEVRVRLSAKAAADADVVLVTVKGRDTTASGLALAPHLRPDAVVVSFQNGLRNPDRLQRALPDHRVIAGMISFNIVWTDSDTGGARFQQATSGPVALLDLPQAAPIADALEDARIAVHRAADMDAVQWAKLILNLNNAVNALSGLPLRQQLSDRRLRKVTAAAMTEAWTVIRAAGLRPVAIGKMRPKLAPSILPLPDWLFRTLAAPMIRIDPAARSSMADDLDRGRRTEIEDMNGEVVALGRAHGIPTPVNARLVELIHAVEAGVEAPPLDPELLLPRAQSAG